ncbi:trypsin inhibitor ClTI-1-like [Hypanus sabinus]|uniref:trypsin inhibitor ClTI-1-like n=1 Tax=Hypanus sabinus TaxID=79690 RepID=UPI0028C3CEA9|nr:trypsin inhibitor ClTI-1-like [Hypanus sabinus]
MKFLLMLEICASVFLAEPVTTVRTPNCSQYFLLQCSRERLPICGTNGVTFSNECMLCLFNREYNKDIKIWRYGGC